jgi:hypothetical protein
MSERKAFFFEKKKQKTFVSCRGLVTGARKRAKVFWFFFSKKNIFLPYHSGHRHRGSTPPASDQEGNRNQHGQGRKTTEAGGIIAECLAQYTNHPR